MTKYTKCKLVKRCTCSPDAAAQICGGVVKYKCKTCKKTVERNPHFAQHHNYNDCGDDY